MDFHGHGAIAVTNPVPNANPAGETAVAELAAISVDNFMLAQPGRSANGCAIWVFMWPPIFWAECEIQLLRK
jgi:hypothetical protein